MTPYVGGHHANMSLASWWLCFPRVFIGSWCQVLLCVLIRFVFVVVWPSLYLLSMVAGSRASLLRACDKCSFAIGEDGQGTSNAVAQFVHVVSDVRRCRAGSNVGTHTVRVLSCAQHCSWRACVGVIVTAIFLVLSVVGGCALWRCSCAHAVLLRL